MPVLYPVGPDVKQGGMAHAESWGQIYHNAGLHEIKSASSKVSEHMPWNSGMT